MITPSQPTWDDLDTTNWDMLYTYDDPMRSQRIADAMTLGTVTRDGPSATISWTESGDVLDGLEAVFARDHFDRTGMGSQTLNSNPTFDTTITPWAGVNGCAVSRDTAIVQTGAGSLLAIPDGVTSNPLATSEDIAVIPGRTYTVKGWIRVSAAGVAGRDFGVSWYDASHAFIATAFTFFSTALPSVWVYCETTVSAPLNAAFAAIQSRATGVRAASDTWRMDEVYLIGSPGSAVGMGTTNLPVPGYPWTVAATQCFSQDGDQIIANPPATGIAYTARLESQPPAIDFDVAIKVKATKLFTGAKGSAYILARWQSATDTLRIRFDFNTDQILGWGLEQVVGGSASIVSQGLVTGWTHDVNQYYWVRAQGAGSSIRIKVWADGQFQDDDWTAVGLTDATFFGTPGVTGIAVSLSGGNTNALPYQNFYFAEFFSGVNVAAEINRITTSMSLDDGLPDGATDTVNSGVSDMVADLAAPIGTPARVFWSTFRSDQPYADIPRDVAGVAVSSGLVTADGIRTARLFTGQMSDIPVSGRQVQLKGISRNRLRMTEPIQPPAINGPYEGCEATWPISYALFKSHVYAAPEPIAGCRLYIPFHGSTHAFIPDNNGTSWPYGVRKYTSPSASTWVRPSFVDGPFVAGMYCALRPGESLTWATNVDVASFAPGADFWSQQGAKGRIEFWVRGDATDLLGAENNTAANVGSIMITQSDQNRYILVGIGAPDRRPYLQMRDGVTTVLIRCDPIPSDGQWHFIGASWDLVNQNFRIIKDTQLVNTGNIGLSLSNLPLADTVDRLRVNMYLPISELRITTGPFGPNAQAPWVKDIPFNASAILRRSTLQLEGLAETDPVEAYAFINGYARGDLASTGFNELDQYQYLTPAYWVDPDRQVEEEILSPDTNLPEDFTPVRDVNKIFNKITVKYKASTVQQLNTKVIETSEALFFPRNSTTVVTFPTLAPLVALRDYAFALRDGTTHASLGLNQYDYVNYATVNTSQDGTGVYATNQIVISVVRWDPGSVTVQFVNVTPANDLYLANNVNLPAFGMGGKTMLKTDDVYTAENAYSKIQRNVRTLDVEAPAIQRRGDAGSLAYELSARLGQPRVRFTSRVFANPERVPGRLVRVQDPNNTNIDKLFRITGVQTSQEGHNIDQTVSAQEVLPVLVWGVGTWGETVWGKPTS